MTYAAACELPESVQSTLVARKENIMRPYYERDGIVLFHGDSGEILPLLGTQDLLLTDPPYGIGVASSQFYGTKKRAKSKAAPRDYGHSEWDKEPPTSELMALVLSAAKKKIVWGGNYFFLPPSPAWLVWDKDNGGVSFADCELAWTNLEQAVRKYRHRWAGMLQENMAAKEDRFHPAQKPVGLMTWCLGFAPDAQRVLDPFTGSGTTGVACIRTGRQFVGIEREERYCEIAAQRFERELNQGRLFVPQAVVPRQLSIAE